MTTLWLLYNALAALLCRWQAPLCHSAPQSAQHKAPRSDPVAQAAAAAGVAGAKAAQAWDAARTAALAAWHSDALAAVRPALAKGAAVASEQARKVQGELEEMLIR